MEIYILGLQMISKKDSVIIIMEKYFPQNHVFPLR